MALLAVAGLVNLETTLKVEGFPLDYCPVSYPFFGVASRVAGVGFNLAKALHTLGSEVNLCTLLAQDWVGDQAQTSLEALGLPIGCVQRQGPANPQSVVLYEPGGRRAIHTDLKDWQDRRYPAQAFAQALQGAALAVLCNINFARDLLPLAQAAGVPIASDVHAIADLEDPYNQDFMAAAQVLFQSHERLSVSPEAWVRAVAKRYGTRVLVVGLGAGGALLYWPQQDLMEQVAVQTPRPVVNTVGAGDALFAAFLHNYAQGWSPPAALRRAVVFAGYKVGADGAAEGFLNGAGLEQLCAQLDNPA